jgi:hypothetical protein
MQYYYGSTAASGGKTPLTYTWQVAVGCSTWADVNTSEYSDLFVARLYKRLAIEGW